uniref:Uncharacterized protein n=1 Tax=viral metagenome TaxID=1070528 RepID=A0A6C0I152_9ZZZZ
MFSPKCYILINKLYDPKKDIINVHKKIKEWIYKMDELILDLDQYNNVFKNIYLYVNNSHFPDNIEIPFYKETMEGWTLIKERDTMKEKYPRQYNQVLVEEKRERREIMKNDERT